MNASLISLNKLILPVVDKALEKYANTDQVAHDLMISTNHLIHSFGHNNDINPLIFVDVPSGEKGYYYLGIALKDAMNSIHSVI